jgi:hypothetical protein
MTDMVLMFAGGVIGYKSKFQTIIVHLSTIAEFVTACDTAIIILFFRSLLQDAGIGNNKMQLYYSRIMQECTKADGSRSVPLVYIVCTTCNIH